VLGPGCPNCKNVGTISKKVVGRLSIDATIAKVSESTAWKKYGLLYTPGLVIGEELVCAGRIPTEAEVTTWIVNALA
jgi:small redox-active disulfide protein 2